MPSKEFEKEKEAITLEQLEATKEVQEKEQAVAQKKVDDATVVFWAKTARCQIANFREEVRAGDGRIIVPEGSIRFNENVFLILVFLFGRL